MKYAWVQNNKIIDIVSVDPSTIFNADIAKNYSTQVEDTVQNNAELINGVWVNQAVIVDLNNIPPAVSALIPIVSPVEFKMLFTSAERIAIKASTDPVIIDFFELINDLRLTQVDRNMQSVKDAVNYLESQKLIDVGRATIILS